MQLLVNGESQEISAGAKVTDLLKLLKLNGPVAVERNGEVVPRAQHAAEELAESDTIEIVHFVGGG